MKEGKVNTKTRGLWRYATNVFITSFRETKKSDPAIEKELSTRCRHCGNLNDPDYNNSESKICAKCSIRSPGSIKDGGATEVTSVGRPGFGNGDTV